MKLWMNLFFAAVFFVLVGASRCSAPTVMDTSAYALEAGQATMTVGGCSRGLTTGYDACFFQKGAKLPKLILVFTNPAEYAVSDCKLGLYKTGSVTAPSSVEVDIAPLSDQLNDSGFCILRVEVIEYYPDPGDDSQTRQYPMAGGWFIEMFDAGYMPVPPDNLAAWCYIVRRTTAGRIKMAPCK